MWQSALFLIGAAVLIVMGVCGGGNGAEAGPGDGSSNGAEGGGGSPWVTGAAVFGKIMMAAAFNGVYVYVVEIFPVEVKGQAMGVCNVAARVGGMAAPLVAELSVSFASTVFGLLALAAALTTFQVLRAPDGQQPQQRQQQQRQVGTDLSRQHRTPQ